MAKLILGIDEAGRGPVIGPMVVAGVAIADEIILEQLGVRDSKELTKKQRNQFYDSIISIADKYEIIIVSAKDIDNALASPDTNLNWLEADTAVKIINKIKPSEVIIDCPSNNILAFTNYINKKINVNTKIKAEHKADQNNASVSAASILAKVTRDKKIQDLAEKYGNFGSGYPSDPLTREFLEKNPDLPIYRKSWSSYTQITGRQFIKEDKKQKQLKEF